MAVMVVVLAAIIVALGMILFAVHKIRPRTLRVTASVARWLSLSLEIEGPSRRIRKRPHTGR